jgi:ParB family chromosome partitioning protein
MSQAPKPRGLGRGLSALLGDEEVAATVAPTVAPAPASKPVADAPQRHASSRAPLTLPTAHLRPGGTSQPRTQFNGLDPLIDSVRQHGLLQPILVRPVTGETNAYEIVAGERRWRAAQKAQLHEVPVVVRNLDMLESLQLALVENLQRADLSPIDEAAGYRRLISEFDQTQEQVAETVGKSRPHVANMLRLLDLPEPVRELVQEGRLSAGQARTLLAFPDPVAMAGRTISEKLTVRDLESLAAGERLKSGAAKKKGNKTGKVEGEKSGDTRALEKRIEEALGLKANLVMTGKGEHTVLTLEISDYEQLDTVVDRLTRR